MIFLFAITHKVFKFRRTTDNMKQKTETKTSKQELIDELWNISKKGSFRSYNEFRKEHPLE